MLPNLKKDIDLLEKVQERAIHDWWEVCHMRKGYKGWVLRHSRPEDYL